MVFKEKKTVYISLLPLLVLILEACAQNPTELAKRYAVTYNTQNVQKIVALYADGAVFEVVGKLTLQGRNSIKNLSDCHYRFYPFYVGFLI